MKARPLLILLLFVASAGILVWIYVAATSERRRPRKSPWAETLTDLDACARNKHVKAAQYDHFAQVADQEGRPGTARLFRAMAFSERLHEYNCANAIVRFGGDYAPPTKVTAFRGTTDKNLQRSIDYERLSLGKPSADIARAMDKGNRYAARMLIWAKAGDLRHLALMEYELHRTAAHDAAGSPAPSGHSAHHVPHLHPGASLPATPAGHFDHPAHLVGPDDLVRLQQADATDTYLVCPVCGNIYDAAYCDPYCPFCLTPARSFIRFE